MAGPRLSSVQRTETDHIHLARAIELAERGNGRVSPNPLVGAVVARDGTVLGEGWHDDYGGPHAEVNAIAACGDADLHGGVCPWWQHGSSETYMVAPRVSASPQAARAARSACGEP